VGRLDRAVSCALDGRLDAAVLDVNLAGEKVFPVADALARRQIPFVFLTACGQDIVPERFWQRPILRKPYRAKPLLAAIEKVAARGPRTPASVAARPRAVPPPRAAAADVAGLPAPSARPATAPGTPAAVVARSFASQEDVATTARARVRTPPLRRKNIELRPREHLTEAEVGLLVESATARSGRHGRRDAAMILLAFRHGLRAGELAATTWDQLDLDRGLFRVRRLRNGQAGEHALAADEVDALRLLRRDQARAAPEGGDHVFHTERRRPMTTSAFRKQLAAIGAAAGLPFSVHPHMLRHACGFELARSGRDRRAVREWLGHRNIKNTAVYAQLVARTSRLRRAPS
jgi:type 1 fimbriae regulatory protein FimB/type 1 fimbriae regulatory protein FimE